MTLAARPIATAIILLAVSSSTGDCSRALTDIVAANAEDVDVGDYSVAAERQGDTLCASVCVANPRRADAVAERILPQLYGKRLRTIVLDLYRERSSIKRVVWTSVLEASSRSIVRRRPVSAKVPREASRNRAGRAANGRPPDRADYFSLAAQSLPITRTELTRTRGAFDAVEPLADPVVAPDVADVVPEVVPDVEPAVPAVPDGGEPDELFSSVPVTSTRLPTFDIKSDELLSSTYVDPMVPRVVEVPLVVPEVPAVVDPVIELVPVDVEPALPLEVAFVRMNDAPAPDPDCVRDVVDPAVVDPPVVPVVPVVFVTSARCRHPTRVTVLV